MDRIMITCGGPQDKWNNHLGVPSHLVKDINGERILERTIRQVRERGYEPDQVLVFHPETEGYFLPQNVSVLVNRPGQYETEYHTTQAWWLTESDDRNVILLGDTWFTDEAMDTILGHTGLGIRFFGHSQPNQITGSPYGEQFGSVWHGMSNWIMLKTMSQLSTMKQRQQLWRFCGWEILYSLQGQRVKPDKHFEHRVTPDFFTEIIDLTGDIDFKEDLAKHPMFGD